MSKFKQILNSIKTSPIPNKIAKIAGQLQNLQVPLSSLQNNPSIFNLAGIALAANNCLSNTLKIDPLNDPGWEAVPAVPGTVHENLFKILSTKENLFKPVDPSYGYKTSLYVCETDSYNIAFTKGYDAGIWYKAKTEHTDFLGYLTQLIWKKNSTLIELSAGSKSKDLKTWEFDKIYETELSCKFSTRIKSFWKKGINHSLLFYGQPGTGKTCLSRTIIEQTQGLTLFIPCSQLQGVEQLTLINIIDFLKPDILFIDDLDSYGSSLSLIDAVRPKVKLLIATANDLNKLGPALIRAGRFDELIKIEKTFTAKDLIPGLSDEQYVELDTWPVAFVSELGKRITNLNCNVEHEISCLRDQVRIQKEFGTK